MNACTSRVISRDYVWAVMFAGCLISLMLLPSCMFWGLKKNIKHLEGLILVGGKVSWDHETAPVVVLLMTGQPGMA
jgi:hypothetical protein